MYKLYKMFTSKAKQLARDKEKETGGGVLGGGVRRDTVTRPGHASLEDEYPPLKLSGQVQEQVKQFKVRTFPCDTETACIDVRCVCTCVRTHSVC